MSTVVLTTQHDTCDQAKPPLPDLELRGYAHAFREWLESAEDFQTFKLCITRELERLGFTDWSYDRLDIPPAARIPVGTFQHDEYYNHAFGPDLMLTHIATTADKSPVFRSTIEKYIEQTPIYIEELCQAQKLFDYYESLGYHDCVGIPLHSCDGKNHAVFTLTIKGEESDDIKQQFSSCEDKTKAIAKIVEDIGNDCYPEFFIGVKGKYERLKESVQIKLLIAMTEHDCGIPEAAEIVGVTRAAADKQLASLRRKLVVRTTHAAVLEAVRLELIR